MNENEENKSNLTFDTVKIKANNKYLLKTTCRFNENYNSQSGEKTSIYYSSKNDANIPFNLFIAVSYVKQTLTIEFSSKILFDDYPFLISKYTIKQCLDNINRLGICEIDVDGILENGCFTKLDVTKDKTFALSDTVLDILNSVVGNYKRYKWTHYDKEGITFVNDVKSKDCKESLIIYNKEKEITASIQNRQFLGMLKDKASVIKSFKNKCRFEITLNTQDKIKTYLEISDTKINTVLNSGANPILKQFDKVFGNVDTSILPNLKSENYDNWSMRMLILQYDYDMKLLEQDLRKKFTSPSGRAKRKKKIDAVYRLMKNEESNSCKVLHEIREMLSNEE